MELLQSDTCQKVEIFISCRKLKDKDVFSKSDPFVVVYLKNFKTKQWYKIGQTEIINDNLNPNFTKSFLLDYMFEIKQEIKFDVRDDDGGSSDSLGYVETTIGAIVGAKSSTLILDLKEDKKRPEGKIILRCENVQECNDIIFMKWIGIKLMNTDGWFDKSDPFLRFSRIREDKTLIQVHETEVIMDNLNPIWKPFEIKLQKLCNGDTNRPIRLECWDWEKSQKFQFIGQCDFTVEDLKNNKKEFSLTHPKHKKPTGTLKCEQVSVVPRPGFLEYIRGGIQLNLMVAVDFTGSNGDPRTAQSLHYFNPMANLMNQYQQAIIAVGEILMNYDYDKMVPCYGFGGVPHYPQMFTNQVSHCFPMTGTANSEVNGVKGILDVYNYSIQNVTLSGPTYFYPILQETQKITELCKQNGSSVYTIMLILTDGEIHDMDKTKDLVVAMSDFPISIIIVGIGQADFTNMEILDGDQGLVNSQGRSAKRDIVQFVPFRELNGSPEMLAKTVLAEIPEQLVNYFRIQGISPKPPPQVNMAQLNMSMMPQPVSNQALQFGQALINQQFVQQQQQQPQPQINQIQPPPQQMSQNAMNFGQHLINQQMLNPQQLAPPQQQQAFQQPQPQQPFQQQEQPPFQQQQQQPPFQSQGFNNNIQPQQNFGQFNTMASHYQGNMMNQSMQQGQNMFAQQYKQINTMNLSSYQGQQQFQMGQNFQVQQPNLQQGQNPYQQQQQLQQQGKPEDNQQNPFGI